MKKELNKISQDLEQGTITELEARTLLLGLLCVSGSYSADELEEMKRLAHEGLPSDCVAGFDEVKFCHFRQQVDGNMCKWCSNYR